MARWSPFILRLINFCDILLLTTAKNSSKMSRIRILGLVSFMFLFANARAEISAESWIKKFPEPRSEVILPSRIITMARDFLQCSRVDDVDKRLVEQINSIARSHFLDNFDEIGAHLTILSDEGNEVATLLLSVLLSEENFTAPDRLRVESLHSRLENADSGFVKSWLTRISWEHASLEEEEQLAAELYSQLDDRIKLGQGDTYINFRAAWFLAFIDGAPVDESKAIKLFESSIDNCPQNALAKMHLGRYLINSFDDDAVIVERGISLMNAATKTGIAEALYWQAEQHSGAAQDFSALSVPLYEKAANLGDPHAAHEVGLMHENGDSTPINLKRAAYFMKLASHLGAPEALISYARYLRDGIGVAANPEESIKYFEAALLANDEYWLELPQTYELIGDLESLEKAKEIYESVMEKPNPDEKSIGVRALSQARAGLTRIKQKTASLNAASSFDYGAGIKPESTLSTLSFGNFHALLIGNEKYQNLSNLESAVQDASDLAVVLGQQFGFETRTLLNATREEILETLNDYRFALEEEDNFFLFYAGHGTYDDETDEGFWQPVDAGDTDSNWISNDRITRTLRGFKSRNVMVVADSCYSGVVFRDDMNRQHISDHTNVDFLRQMLERKTRVAITSGGLEPVVDRLPGTKNSIFTGALIAKLRSLRKVTTAQEVYLDVSEDVVSSATSIGIQQTPEYAGLRRSGHDGGDFLFVPVSP
jgi:TPR repeat protein